MEACKISLKNYFEFIWSKRLYQCVADYIDNAFGFVKLPKHITEDWKHTLKSVDLITVTPHTLKNQVGEFRKNNVYLVSNGVEYNYFAETPDTSSPPRFTQ